MHGLTEPLQWAAYHNASLRVPAPSSGDGVLPCPPAATDWQRWATTNEPARHAVAMHWSECVQSSVPGVMSRRRDGGDPSHDEPS